MKAQQNGRMHTVVSVFALLATAVTSGAVIYFIWWLIDLLAAPNWCDRALGAAEKADARNEFGVGGCFNLLNAQVDALAMNSHFLTLTLALCLLVLMVIVIAQARLSLKVDKTGASADMSSKDDAAAGARRVKEVVNEAAAETVDEIEQEAAPKVPPKPDFKTYPEPEIET